MRVNLSLPQTCPRMQRVEEAYNSLVRYGQEVKGGAT